MSAKHKAMAKCCLFTYQQYLIDGKVDQELFEKCIKERGVNGEQTEQLRKSPCMCVCHEVGTNVFH